MPAPLLVSDDPVLIDDLSRLAAAAGVACDVARDAPSALRGWGTAPLVLLGHDLAADVARRRPPRRPDVVLLGRADPDYRAAVEVGADDVVCLPEAEARLVDLLADAGDGVARVALTVGVVGGSGGVGASTLASALALLGGHSGRAALVDLDPWGCGLDVLTGVDEEAGVRWSDLAASNGRLGSRALREALPQRDGVAVLASSPLAEPDPGVVREVITSLQRGSDLVVVDLARGVVAGEVAGEVVARCDRVVLVGPCTVAGVAASSRVLRALAERCPDVWFVARTSRASADPATVAAALELPLVATLPDQRGLAEQLDLGLGPVARRRSAVTRAAQQVLTRLAGAER